MSEQILLLNPRPKKRRHTRRRARRANRRGRVPAGLARYMAGRRRARRANPRRRARRANGRRRVMRTGRHYLHAARRHNRRHVARRHTRRHARRHNPRYNVARIAGMGRGIVGGYVIPSVLGGAGALLLDMAWGFLAPKLPTQVQSGYASTAAKLGVILGAAWVMNRFLPKFRTQTHRAAIGASTVLAYVAIKGAAQSVLPAGTPGLSGYIDFQSYALPGAHRMAGYMPRQLGSLEDLYSPAAVIQPVGTPVPRQFGSLSGYIAVQPHMATGGGLMGYDWQNDGM